MPKRLQMYEGGGVVVSFDPNVCIHAADCIRGLPTVFDVKLKRRTCSATRSAGAFSGRIHRLSFTSKTDGSARTHSAA